MIIQVAKYSNLAIDASLAVLQWASLALLDLFLSAGRYRFQYKRPL